MMHIYELTSERIVHSYYKFKKMENYDNYRKFFSSLKKAVAYAEKEYSGKIQWRRLRKRLESPELIFVKYYIRQYRIEE
jgi:hypothetical protein